ncbi:uncharacterized protein LOC143174309 isoform X2 [Nomia melanderi]|uniref:uncharacterized protein LOC143174309 isoform X2 n=1 Tax=Nomia melanderi TaxID=2448451 RepID=UPI003FCD925D
MWARQRPNSDPRNVNEQTAPSQGASLNPVQFGLFCPKLPKREYRKPVICSSSCVNLVLLKEEGEEEEEEEKRRRKTTKKILVRETTRMHVNIMRAFLECVCVTSVRATLWLDNASTRITPEQPDQEISSKFLEHRLSYSSLSSVSWEFCCTRSQSQSIQEGNRKKTRQRQTKSSIPADNDTITGEGEIVLKADGSSDR